MNNINFTTWANSFSGCDGGNKDASIWVSGIEWGLGKEQKQTNLEYEEYLENYFQRDLPQSIQKGKAEISSIYDWEEQLKYNYGKILAKLYLVIKDKSIESYKNLTLFKGNEIFKINLYPIAFPNTNDNTYQEFWEKYNLEKTTGFDNNTDYRYWCFYNRFPIFTEFLKSNKESKLIICTGTDYIFDFCSAFITDKYSIKIHNEKIKTVTKKGNVIYKKFYWIFDKNNLIVVVPFFTGRNGLNSNEIIIELASRIKNILKGNKIFI
ncbi:hypothetical protein [Leptospira kanakyensis]|uniref:hypothetical protein n=1 Tax=Leptospira kanakyensis TaxID=2484968 RepID=UPI00223E5A61|nr:hypothetical protein [Leptospira kanakyensis]MCW7471837.1 hypothetical protein [Leptospira kanakyensis]